ncbi:ATP-dependent DNA helicase PIF1 [Culex quinquefasciatus]|uniref:ATP-dependent DNA helicase PIF1 n=1 Tax=Culex quinquefasciatus TaxID=7176 RepID=UPI0018E39CE6|nr:ATP-dependent DNA helicase PIF1 [Culex quinquefasciatus]
MQRCYEMASRPTSASIWRKCKRLVIDEISMVDGDYLRKPKPLAITSGRTTSPSVESS